MNCCNPFNPIIDYVEDMCAQPSVIQKLIELSKQWDSLNVRVANLEDQAPAELVSRVEQLEQTAQNLQQQINSNHQSVEDALNGIQIELDTIDVRLESHTDDLANINSQLNQIDQTLNSKANSDASNLTDEEIEAWKEKIGGGEGGEKINVVSVLEYTFENLHAFIDSIKDKIIGIRLKPNKALQNNFYTCTINTSGSITIDAAAPHTMVNSNHIVFTSNISLAYNSEGVLQSCEFEITPPETTVFADAPIRMFINFNTSRIGFSRGAAVAAISPPRTNIKFYVKDVSTLDFYLSDFDIFEIMFWG